MPSFWLAVAHAHQVGIIRAKGLVAFSKGQKAPVTKVATGDRAVYDAPRTDFEGDQVQAFVVMATVTGAAAFETSLAGETAAWVCEAVYDDASNAPIRPMIPDLSFIGMPSHWGVALGRSHFEVPEADISVIARAMAG